MCLFFPLPVEDDNWLVPPPADNNGDEAFVPPLLEGGADWLPLPFVVDENELKPPLPLNDDGVFVLVPPPEVVMLDAPVLDNVDDDALEG